VIRNLVFNIPTNITKKPALFYFNVHKVELFTGPQRFLNMRPGLDNAQGAADLHGQFRLSRQELVKLFDTKIKHLQGFRLSLSNYDYRHT
jgi:hypothetical protein